jgi:hypothetical protein
MEVIMAPAAPNTLARALLATGFAAAIALMSLPQAHSAQKDSGPATDVQVLSGGVGEGERKQLESQAREHNLKLVFTMSTGNYLAEVPFQIERGGKVIAEETAKGPWAFVKLPPGSYTVKATYEGKTLNRKVNVPKSGQHRVAFTWPATERVSEQPQTR